MAEFRGSLYVFVDIPREDQDVSAAMATDSIFGTGEPGAKLWYLTGWAIGKNDRGSYCARTSTSKLRSFGTFAEAMDLVRKKRKARPNERFHIVYEVDGRKSIVTSLEQIQQLLGHMDRTLPGPGHDGDALPELETLTAKVGKIVATNALVLLRTLTQEGESVARTRFSNATYERLWRVLSEAALVDNGGAQFARLQPSPETGELA